VNDERIPQLTADQAFNELGWAIIPANKNKRPLITAWKEFQSRAPTPEEFSAWQKLNPAGWALITGAVNGRVTLDFDGQQGQQLLLIQLGIEAHRRTPSGKTKRELGKKYPGLDIRADGGYVLFSGHTEKGEYHWLRGPTPHALGLLPEELRADLGLLHPPQAKPQPKPGTQQHRADGHVEAERLIRMALERAPGEGRNNTGFWLAAQLRDNAFEFASAHTAMLDYRSRVPDINTKGQPEGYTEEEVMATLREVFRQPPREPWTHRPAAEPEPSPAQTSPGPPQIQIVRGGYPVAVNQAEETLLVHYERLKLFCRGGSDLVRVVQLTQEEKGGGLLRPAGIVKLVPVTETWLTETLDKLVEWLRWDARDSKTKRIDCPEKVARNYLGRAPEWKLPWLTGIITVPIIRPDGTILERPGYDKTTELFLTEGDWLPVPSSPTPQQITEALNVLQKPLAEFHFVSLAARSVMMAAIFTAIQRRLLPSAPLFAFDAPSQRSGKTLLACIVAIIAMGREVPSREFVKDQDELRKSLFTALREGHPIINLDNIVGTFDSPNLAPILTQLELHRPRSRPDERRNLRHQLHVALYRKQPFIPWRSHLAHTHLPNRPRRRAP
jgi:hypothetical protein